MLGLFNQTQAVNYSTKEVVDNDLTKEFIKNIYGDTENVNLFYALDYMKNNKIDIISAILPIYDITAQYGNSEDIDLEYCKEHNIITKKIPRSGGCILCFPGNIFIYDTRHLMTLEMREKCANDFTQWLIDKGLNATTDNNDVMVDNKKVAGMSMDIFAEPYLGISYLGGEFTINCDKELIKKVCKKESTKEPGALSDYGITTEEVYNWLANGFANHQN